MTSIEADTIEQFWLEIYYLATITTLFRYFKKQFIDDAVYRRHRRLWWGIILLAAAVHLSVATYAEGYCCVSAYLGIQFCQPSFIPFIAALLLAIAMGPANRQNTGNKGEEGVIVLLVVLLLFSIFLEFEWLKVIDSSEWLKNISSNEAVFVVFICLLLILLAKLLYGFAGLVGFQGTLSKISKFFLFWLSWLLNDIFILALFALIRERLLN